MLKRKLVLILAFTVVLFGLTLYSYGGYGQNTAYPQGPVIGHSDRVLIVAPHPDDETIDNTGIIRYCIEKTFQCTWLSLQMVGILLAQEKKAQ